MMCWICRIQCVIISVLIVLVFPTGTVGDPGRSLLQPLEDLNISCDRIDAAFLWSEKLVLFSGNRFVEVNNRTETYNGMTEMLKIFQTIDEWDDLPEDIDAAVEWTSNGQDFFFKGPQFYRYSLAFLLGPYKSEEWWNDYIAEGIDAAGNKGQTTHFFKGCTYMTWSWLPSSGSKVYKLPAGIPCNIDAAWELQDNPQTLVLLKYDQVYYWQNAVSGPHKFSDVYNVTTLKLCPGTFY